MKKNILFVCVTLLLLTAGCTGQETEPSASGALQSIGPPESAPAESADSAIPQELKDLCEDRVYGLFFDSTLFNTWEGAPVPPDESPAPTNVAIQGISRADDIITVTAELYGNIYIDPLTREETIGYGPVWIMPEGEPHAPQLAFGKSVVRFEESGGLLPLSCTYEKYPHPGLDYLKSQTERLQTVLSASEKLDISDYNQQLVNYIWQVLFAHRFIEKPEDITLYDLESLREGIELHHGTIGADTEDPDYRLDASLLALMPNLESVYSIYLLQDYRVFENMNHLKQLRIQWPGNELFGTLRVGHTDQLMLDDPDTDMLDLTGVNADALCLNSWSTAVRGFTGCEQIKKLYIMSTRTDMRLVNAEAFPNVSYLNLYFYSDTPRVRDFSQLAGFHNVKIDLYLDYQACNNQTIESLQGVKLNDLYLHPENGSYPLNDFDDSLIEKLDAQNITFGMEMYFQERTGLEEGGNETQP